MAKDDRDMLEILQEELDFIEKGGYGRSVRTPWLAKSIFQDSLSCLNYGSPDHAQPCNECKLIDLVAPKDQSAEVPCHCIPLQDEGTTIEDLENGDNQPKLENTVRVWLQQKIVEIERQRAQPPG